MVILALKKRHSLSSPLAIGCSEWSNKVGKHDNRKPLKLAWQGSTHVYEVRPRSDKRGVDLISDALPFGRLGIL
jgi:hypothetical protein